MAMLHQGKNIPAKKLKTAVNSIDKVNFIV
jgi:hypothetical protein